MVPDAFSFERRGRESRGYIPRLSTFRHTGHTVSGIFFKFRHFLEPAAVPPRILPHRASLALGTWLWLGDERGGVQRYSVVERCINPFISNECCPTSSVDAVYSLQQQCPQSHSLLGRHRKAAGFYTEDFISVLFENLMSVLSLISRQINPYFSDRTTQATWAPARCARRLARQAIRRSADTLCTYSYTTAGSIICTVVWVSPLMCHWQPIFA